MTLKFVAGWCGERDESVFFSQNNHPSTGTNVYLQELILELKEKFFNEDLEVHFNVQPSVSKKQKILVLLENVAIRPQNYFYRFVNYKRIFGWDLSLAHLKNFHYVRYPHDYTVGKYNPDRRIEYCMISSNRNLLLGNKKLSLYNKRQEVITHFDYAETPFELYGSGWGSRYVRPGLIDAILTGFSRRICKSKEVNLFPYKGRLKDKQGLLNEATFNFCYENISCYEGYVSEKIWDAIAAGCIPVYWPSWSVPEEYVPKWAYVDASKYSTVYNLIKYLESISVQERLDWQKNLLKLAKEKEKFMQSENYVRRISNEIHQCLK